MKYKKVTFCQQSADFDATSTTREVIGDIDISEFTKFYSHMGETMPIIRLSLNGEADRYVRSTVNRYPVPYDPVDIEKLQAMQGWSW